MGSEKSLKAKGNDLAVAQNQLDILNDPTYTFNQDHPSFKDHLAANGLYPLKSTSLDTLQINLGKMCNQTCTHCHVDAGPDRKEIMTNETMAQCLNAIRNSDIKTVDLTGGAPELNPHFRWFVEQLSQLNVKVIVRSNLTIIRANKKYYDLPKFFKKHNITVISSLPCYTKENVDKQRGIGVFKDSIDALISLNKVGYGVEGSGLELDLVFNPGGPGLPPEQASLEKDYKTRMKEDFDIVFNRLYTITNLPISRFLDFLQVVVRTDEYMHKLINAFNLNAAKEVMCRNLISVSWDGQLYDCDFNQMLEMKTASTSSQHIKDFNANSLAKRVIQLDQHCFGCTAGSGSSCGGSLV